MSSINAEQDVLGCIFCDNDVMDMVSTNLKPNDFFHTVNKEIYTAMLHNYHNNKSNNTSTVYDVIKNHIEIISKLDCCMPSSAHVKSYVDIVKEASNVRQIKEVFELVTKFDYTSEQQTKIIKEMLEEITIVDNTKQHHIKDEIIPYGEDIISGRLLKTFHTTQYNTLNNILGIENGNLIIIAARTAVGKTAFALNLVNHFAKNENVGFISLEMTSEEIYSRLISLDTGINNNRMKFNTIGLKEKDQITKSTRGLTKSKLTIFDEGGLKIEQLQNMCRKLKQENKLDILIVDYLGLLRTNQYQGQKVNETAYISNTLKQIAMNLKIPVIALSQLNRQGTDEPQLVHLKNSGSIEEDANAVILLHDISDGKNPRDKQIKLIVAKNRSGATGEVEMNFKPHIMKFTERLN